MFPAPPNFSTAVHPLPPFSFGSSAPFPNAPNVPQQSFLPQDPLHQRTADPNSPEVFKNNVTMLHQQVSGCKRLREGQNAYQTGNSPAHTEADIATLKQMLALVLDAMRQSGVGALPVLPTVGGIPAAVPTEAQLLASTTQNLRALYEKLQRSQESAAVSANLLLMDHPSARTGAQK
ncbi:hypothetical protein BJ912DRAFT_1058764 [Pholiota molesta]|nr:hypothetical protein BJ912DRAFT_1058764 [Pholiota molesta]